MDLDDTGLKMIGLCNCPITGVRLQPTVRLQLCRLINANTAVYSPITFEEIVMVMINRILLAVLTREISSYKIHIHARACNILYFFFNKLR